MRRSVRWLPKEKTAVRKLLLRHSPERIFAMAKISPQKQVGRPSELDKKVAWTEYFLTVKATYKGARDPSAKAFWEIYQEEKLNDPRGDRFQYWVKTKRKWITAGKKALSK